MKTFIWVQEDPDLNNVLIICAENVAQARFLISLDQGKSYFDISRDPDEVIEDGEIGIKLYTFYNHSD